MKDLLPRQPVESVVIEPWWVVQTGYIVEEDIKVGTGKLEERRKGNNPPKSAIAGDFQNQLKIYLYKVSDECH